jgi:uracil phosphoribosyltransferase
MLDVLPQARLGHVGTYRNEETFAPMSYYFKAPRDLEDLTFSGRSDAGHRQQRYGCGDR